MTSLRRLCLELLVRRTKRTCPPPQPPGASGAEISQKHDLSQRYLENRRVSLSLGCKPSSPPLVFGGGSGGFNVSPQPASSVKKKPKKKQPFFPFLYRRERERVLIGCLKSPLAATWGGWVRNLDVSWRTPLARPSKQQRTRAADRIAAHTVALCSAQPAVTAAHQYKLLVTIRSV